jgi:hypothetical protein
MGIMKPFKAPSLVGKNTLNNRPPPQLDEDRPNKKRRVERRRCGIDHSSSKSAQEAQDDTEVSAAHTKAGEYGGESQQQQQPSG